MFFVFFSTILPKPLLVVPESAVVKSSEKPLVAVVESVITNAGKFDGLLSFVQ